MNLLEKILKEILQYRKDHDLYAGRQVMEIERIIRSHMKDLPDICVGKWIPVTEWLPEMDRNVLVTVNGSYNRISYCNAIEIGRIRWGGKWEIEGLQEWDDPEVTAWMLMPEAYRPSGE